MISKYQSEIVSFTQFTHGGNKGSILNQFTLSQNDLGENESDST